MGVQSVAREIVRSQDYESSPKNAFAVRFSIVLVETMAKFVTN